MANGPYWPYSVGTDLNGLVFPRQNISSGGKLDNGIGVSASLSSDSVAHLRFIAPLIIPSGQPTLNLLALADATSGQAVIDPAWIPVSALGSVNTARISEGQTSVIWTAGQNEVFKLTQVSLDASPITSGQIIMIDLAFKTTGWTLAIVSLWHAFLSWE